ncbi:MAG TPA: Mth938-like domain-containing protein [Stellaceae bacterium]|nr:Mth938-like domain-containing protein [Stellaceae bacterium]
MDITPVVAPDRQVVEAYGEGGFRISGVTFAGPVIVCTDATTAWPVSSFADMTIANLEPIRNRVGTENAVEILLIGCGKRAQFVPAGLRTELKKIGVVVDTMDTGAACRTYDVLLAEGRRVAAALLPPRQRDAQ